MRQKNKLYVAVLLGLFLKVKRTAYPTSTVPFYLYSLLRMVSPALSTAQMTSGNLPKNSPQLCPLASPQHLLPMLPPCFIEMRQKMGTGDGPQHTSVPSKSKDTSQCTHWALVLKRLERTELILFGVLGP